MDENINQIQDAEFQELDATNSAAGEENSKADKVASLLGFWSGAIVLTLIAACLLAFCVTLVPTDLNSSAFFARIFV